MIKVKGIFLRENVPSQWEFQVNIILWGLFIND